MLAMLLIKANRSCMNMYVAESIAIKLDCRTFRSCRSSSTAHKNAHFCVQLTKECNRPANNDSALHMLKINIHQCICICMTCICST